MFDGSDFPKSLDDALFESWLEQGRASKISYGYLMIIWDAYEAEYIPKYAEARVEFNDYEVYSNSTDTESLIAVYDLYSESRISLRNK